MPVRAMPVRRSFTSAFTLVELLVVIGVISVLIGILMPALSRAHQAAQATRCQSNLRQIGMAMRLYAQSYNEALQTNYKLVGGGVNWIDTWQPAGATNALRLADPLNTKSYWGTAYLPFIASKSIVYAEGNAANQIVDYARGIWFCPSSNGTSLRYNLEPTYPVSYGLNALLTGASGTWTNGKSVQYRKLSSYKMPSEVIVAHDSIIPLLGTTAPQSNSTLSAGTSTTNLRDWRPPNGGAILAGFSADGTCEFYRHARQCNVLYVDGHVGRIAESLGTDVPMRMYTGRLE